jgi:hypothetical protein
MVVVMVVVAAAAAAGQASIGSHLNNFAIRQVQLVRFWMAQRQPIWWATHCSWLR